MKSSKNENLICGAACGLLLAVLVVAYFCIFKK